MIFKKLLDEIYIIIYYVPTCSADLAQLVAARDL